MKLPNKLFVAIEGSPGEQYLVAYESAEEMEEGENEGRGAIYHLAHHISVKKTVTVSFPRKKHGE
jgi:hypothetical protein